MGFLLDSAPPETGVAPIRYDSARTAVSSVRHETSARLSRRDRPSTPLRAGEGSLLVVLHGPRSLVRPPTWAAAGAPAGLLQRDLEEGQSLSAQIRLQLHRHWSPNACAAFIPRS